MALEQDAPSAGEVMGLDMNVQNQDKSGDKYIGVKGTVPILKKRALAGTFFNIRDMYLENLDKY